MAIPRRETIVKSEQQYMHLYARCVRRAYLCGADRVSGRNFDYRRDWIVERLMLLTSIYSFQLIAYGICSNHTHVIGRSLPDIAQAWTPEEVLRRWDRIHPLSKQRDENYKPVPLTEAQLTKLAADTKRTEVYRDRLMDVSWLMKDLNEFVARRANREDFTTGHFWESRFKHKILLDECALITELVYVDLNPIRAGLAATPEESDYTSVQARINARDAKLNLADLSRLAEVLPADDTAGLDELSQLAAGECEKAESADWLCSLDHGDVLPLMSLDHYLALVDCTGRRLRDGKCGVIDADLAPILERLQVRQENWLVTVAEVARRFRVANGKASSLEELAKKRGKQRVFGRPAAQKSFKP